MHFTIVDGDKMTKTDFCVECAEPLIKRDEGFELGELAEILRSGEMQTMAKDYLANIFSFPPEAYKFVKETLNESQRQSGHHDVTGRQLLNGARELALRKFGKQAKRALAELRIFRTEDIGEIVFEMVEAGMLNKRPEDSREDFVNGFDFDEAFPEK